MIPTHPQKIFRAIKIRTRKITIPVKEKILTVREGLFPTADPVTLEAIKALRKRIESLPPLPSQPTSSADGKWLAFRAQIRDFILRRDPSGFLRWEPIKSTMSISRLDRAELEHLKGLPDSSRWMSALDESAVGRPIPFPAHPKSSANLIHHAYSLAKFSGAFPIDISLLRSVVEIGGGYGSMRRLFYNLGFRGDYTIFDLPEFLALQQFFLSLVIGKERAVETIFVSDADRLATSKDPDLLIATWSISEMSIKTRETILCALGRPRYILIAYQGNFGEVDNFSYFRTFTETRPEYEWKLGALTHLTGSGNYHLFGRLK